MGVPRTAMTQLPDSTRAALPTRDYETIGLAGPAAGREPAGGTFGVSGRDSLVWRLAPGARGVKKGVAECSTAKRRRVLEGVGCWGAGDRALLHDRPYCRYRPTRSAQR